MNTTLKTSLKWAVIAGLFIIPFIPFIVTKSLLFPFITGKAFFFRILIEIIFALWVLLAIADHEYRPRWNAVSKTVVAFVGVVLLADLFSKYPFKSFWSNYERMEGFVEIAHIAAYYFIVSSMFKTELWWKRFWNTELVAATGIAVYGFLQIFGKIAVNQGGVRLDATFGNASYLAIYTVFNICIAVILLIRDRRTMWKWIYGVAALLQLVVLYFTATRGAILGLIGGILLAACIMLIKTKRNDSSKKIARRVSASLLGGVVVLLLVFVAVRNTSFVRHNQVLGRFTDFSLSSQENQGRKFVWPMAIKGFTERPILGWGQENFNYVFNKNYNPAAYNQEQWFDRTHDIFLDWLISAGSLGLLAYLSLFFGFFYLLFKKTNFPIEEKALLFGLMGAYVFHNIFVFDNQTSYILFFSILAWVSALSTTTEKTAKVGKVSREISSETLNYLIAPVVVILLVVSLYFVNTQPLMANQNLIKGISSQSTGPQANLDYFKQAFAKKSFGSSEILEQLVSISLQIIQTQNNAQVTDTIKQGFYTLTDEQIKLQVARTPQDARYLLLAGSFYNRVGQYDQAIMYLNDAIKYSPNKPAMLFELATAYLGKSDADKAFELFKKGYDLAPQAPDSQIIYAVGALYDKKPDVVAQLFDQIGQSRIISDDRILSTYVNIKDYPHAEEIILARIAKDPTNVNIQLQLASLYITSGDKARAIRIIKDVEEKAPDTKAQLDPYIEQLSK